MKINGVLFDKDGTLIDFHATWNDAFEHVVEELVGPDPEAIERLMEITGFDAARGRFRAGSLGAASTTDEIAEAWLPHLKSDRKPQNLAGWMDERFVRHSGSGPVALTDLAALFGELRHRGLKVGIATSDSEAGARATLAYFGCAHLVDFIAGYDSGYGIKPGPGMPLGFARACGLAPSEIAVVGDNLHDLQMGRSAGVGLCVGVLSGTGDRETLAGATDHLLPDVSALSKLLDSLA